MPKYVHELKNWPVFTWEADRLVMLLSEVRHKQGRLLGKLEGLGFRLQEEATLETIIRLEIGEGCEVFARHCIEGHTGFNKKGDFGKRGGRWKEYELSS